MKNAEWPFGSDLPAAQQVPTSTLAYLGDACYELYLRSWLLTQSQAKSGALHRRGIAYANAGFQAKVAQRWRDDQLLTPEEEAVLLRGRNGHPGTKAKHASPMDYRWATALETLIGWLYLNQAHERIATLLKGAFEGAVDRRAMSQTPQSVGQEGTG